MERLKQQKMTLEEFDKLPEDNTYTYELIDGELLMQSRPNVRHQAIMFNLSIIIGNYLKNKPCRAFTEVELEINSNVIVPDISVLCSVDDLDIQRFKQPPALIIEILIPSNTVKELKNKILKYKNHKIKELWIVDPYTMSIEINNLETSTAITQIQSGTVKSNVFPDLEIDLSAVFE